MRAIAKYPFVGDPAQKQLSFPAGVELDAKSKSEHHGWMWGIYQDKHGWFPVSYVKLQRPVRPPERKQQRYIPQPGNPVIPPYPTDPPVSSMPFVTPTRDDEEGFCLMGGEPGGLVDVPSSPIYPTSSINPDSSPPPVLYPTDVYSHRHHTNDRKTGSRDDRDYGSDVAIYITDKVAPTSTPDTTPDTTPVTSPQGPPQLKQTLPSEQFWKTHPPRATGPSSVEHQSVAIEGAFEKLEDNDNIEIVDEPKKKRLSLLPKKLKNLVKRHPVKAS